MATLVVLSLFKAAAHFYNRYANTLSQNAKVREYAIYEGQIFVSTLSTLGFKIMT